MNDKVFILLIVISSFVCGQDLSAIKAAFKDFRYDEVISISRQLYASGQIHTEKDSIEILRMKATAHYASGEIDSSAFCFDKMISIDATYQLDSIQNSPKIIALFNQIKAEHIKNRALRRIPYESPEIDQKKVISGSPVKKPFYGALIRSMALPGWGHYHLEQKKKGMVLGAAGLALLSSSVYFILETDRLENEYLNELDPLVMDDRYKKYDKAYKLRNISIACYAVLWLYSQIDLSNGAFFETEIPDKTEMQAFINADGIYCINFQYKF
ncbi:MAG: hypothetical protein JXR46_03155 [Calditrichaceae bacterium]|nr:hypothetical protein [Calditrichaceae bacterium]MBN2708023.1 hypothetical protein [Calditrichaceae bacterium]RQV93964.1 MAG: hypothetical protein EH224_11455 [Calditrichota bacterium]